MALNFEYINTIPNNEQPFISYDTTSALYNYYINQQLEKDKQSVSDYGKYSHIFWDNEGSRITTKNVLKIGGKNVPSSGIVAFYKDAITGLCNIVHVINYNAPILETVEHVNNQLHIIITPPSGVHYDCYRIVLTQGKFAFEFIFVEPESYINTPLVKGEYEVYCYGYDESNNIISPRSATLSLTVISGLDNWKPFFANQMDSVLARLLAAETNISNTQDDVEDIQEDISNIQNDIEDIQGDIEDIQGDISNIQNTIGDISELLDDFNGEVI